MVTSQNTAGENRPDVAGHLVLDTLAGQRATQLSHHDRIAPHPHIGIDVAQRNVPQPHPPLLPGPSICAAPAAIRMPSIIDEDTDKRHHR